MFPRPVEASLVLATVIAGLIVGSSTRLEVRTGRKTAESCEPTVRGEVEVALEVGSSGLSLLKLVDEVRGAPLRGVLSCWSRDIADGVVEGEAPSSSLCVGCKG